MSLLDKRAQISEDILKKRFIRRVMQEAATDIDKAQRMYMTSRGFENADWHSGRSFEINDQGLDYSHLKKLRFVDMKTRKTKEGIVRKKSHPVHNKIIWGHYNNIIKELHFGFTEAIKEELRTIEE